MSISKNYQTLEDLHADKTRVAIVSSARTIARLVIHVLEFNKKSIHYQFEGQAPVESPGSDFILVDTQDLSLAAELAPNIVLLTTLADFETYTPLISRMVSGGILVYPSRFTQLYNELKNAPTFFRKIPFEVSEVNADQLNTALGAIPLSFQDQGLMENLEGIQHLLQHLGIMEEEFYEALIAFEMQD